MFKWLKQLMWEIIWDESSKAHCAAVESNFREVNTCPQCEHYSLDDDEEGEQRGWCDKHKVEAWDNTVCDDL